MPAAVALDSPALPAAAPSPSQDKACDEQQRCIAVALLTALARGGGSALWANGGHGWEEGCRMCVALLEDSSQVG